MGKIAIFFLINPEAYLNVKKVDGNWGMESEKKAWQEILGQSVEFNDWEERTINNSCKIFVRNRAEVYNKNDRSCQVKQKICNEINNQITSKNLNGFQIKVYAHYTQCDQLTGQKCINNVTILAYSTSSCAANAKLQVEDIIRQLKERKFTCDDYFKDKGDNEERRLTEQAEEERKKRNLTHLFHSTAHLFLPLDIDLMGISEVEDKVDYLKDILNDKEKNHYKKKLLEFTYYVAGIKNVSINGSQLKANIEEDDFSGENCIKKIIEQSNFSEKSLKQNLCILSGIKDNQIDKESLLFKFMDLLDNKIEKKNTSNGLSKNDVDEILNFFNNKNWQVEEVNPSQIKSFHDWFCAIMNCLEDIKTKLTTK